MKLRNIHTATFYPVHPIYQIAVEMISSSQWNKFKCLLKKQMTTCQMSNFNDVLIACSRVPVNFQYFYENGKNLEDRRHLSVYDGQFHRC